MLRRNERGGRRGWRGRLLSATLPATRRDRAAKLGWQRGGGGSSGATSTARGGCTRRRCRSGRTCAVLKVGVLGDVVVFVGLAFGLGSCRRHSRRGSCAGTRVRRGGCVAHGGGAKTVHGGLGEGGGVVDDGLKVAWSGEVGVFVEDVAQFTCIPLLERPSCGGTRARRTRPRGRGRMRHLRRVEAVSVKAARTSGTQQHLVRDSARQAHRTVWHGRRQRRRVTRRRGRRCARRGGSRRRARRVARTARARRDKTRHVVDGGISLDQETVNGNDFRGASGRAAAHGARLGASRRSGARRCSRRTGVGTCGGARRGGQVGSGREAHVGRAKARGGLAGRNGQLMIRAGSRICAPI